MPDKTEFRPGLRENTAENNSFAEQAANVAQVVKDEAAAVKTVAAEHPHSLSLMVALVAIAGYLIGHAAGFRSAEQQYAPPPRRSW